MDKVARERKTEDLAVQRTKNREKSPSRDRSRSPPQLSDPPTPDARVPSPKKSPEKRDRKRKSRTLQCKVKGCKESKFQDHAHFRQHWVKYHVRYSQWYACPVAGCGATRRREDYIRVHLSDVHKVKDPRKDYPPSSWGRPVRENHDYLDPKGVEPIPDCRGAIDWARECTPPPPPKIQGTRKRGQRGGRRVQAQRQAATMSRSPVRPPAERSPPATQYVTMTAPLSKTNDQDYHTLAGNSQRQHG